MTQTKCSLCNKKIEIKVKECDESGMAWHCYCFRCYTCGAPLNENTVNMRGDDNKLYCSTDFTRHEGKRPAMKAYGIGTIFRITF